MTREANLFARLKDRVTRPTDRFERVENGVGDGWPDVNYCIVGQEGWIELKAPILPARPETPLFGSNHPVGLDQINWFYRQHAARGLAWLFIGTRESLVMINGFRVASLGRRINTLPLRELERIAAWTEKLPVENLDAWADLRELLASPVQAG